MIYKENIYYIKSKHILKQIFVHLSQKIALEIIHHSKKVQERLDINIDDYKKYSKRTEIDIRCAKNKYGKFININKEDESYFHIYFNDNNE